MTLICITTYNHSALVKAFIWDYILFVQGHENFDFVLSLDGSDKETIKYCERFGIPLIYSEKNEGVGISKNRVIETLPGYDNYFFIEDDVELLNPAVFDIHIDLSKKLDIHHFSLYPAWRSMEQVGELTTNNYHIIQTMYGSAQVNFFTRQGLDKVGGFHPMFSQYKRFGHTEHTYRFYHAGLSKYPFHIIKECIEGYFVWHEPKSRINAQVSISENRLFIGEEMLMKEKLTYYPIETLSEYHLMHMENLKAPLSIKIDPYFKIYKKKFYFIETLKKFKRLERMIIKWFEFHIKQILR